MTDRRGINSVFIDHSKAIHSPKFIFVFLHICLMELILGSFVSCDVMRNYLKLTVKNSYAKCSSIKGSGRKAESAFKNLGFR